MAKDADYVALMNSTRWRRLRAYVLSRRPLCDSCLAVGRITGATEVHHVIPVETGLTRSDKEALAYDAHNLRPLCHACHVAVHTAMGRSGKEAARKRREERREAERRKLFGGEAPKI